ncbi:MAG: hypothetical protein GXP24_09980, partial [Planctomycetes bacterium]|nr:hypothetical protein [Planctomycetota bacterium]
MFKNWKQRKTFVTFAATMAFVTGISATVRAEEVATAVEAEAEKVEPQIVKLADGKILLPV